jgi:hypothetical protein
VPGHHTQRNRRRPPLSAVRRRLGTRFAVPAAISFLALALAAPAAAAVPAATATIPVGSGPYGVAVNPLTGTGTGSSRDGA